MSEIGAPASSNATLDYGRAKRHSKWLRRFYVFTWIVTLIFIAGFTLAIWTLPSFGVPREHTDRLKCASNLKEIGLAIEQYADTHGGQFPAALTDLTMHPRIWVNGAKQSAVTPEEFICPASADTPAKGMTDEGATFDFQQPGHCSYIYVGKGLNANTATSDTVVAYEVLSHHKNRGMNILFGDGHVDFLQAPGALPWVAAAKGGPVVTPGGAAPATMP